MRIVIAAVMLAASLSVANAQKIELPRALVADAFEKAECEVPLEDALKDLESSGALGRGLHLVAVSCWRAAYNFGRILFAVDPAKPKEGRLLQFDDFLGRKPVKQYALSSPGYDEKKKELQTFHKGRGPGDCGSAGRWRWNGTEFVLEVYWLKEKCDGKVFDPREQPRRYRIFTRKK